MREKWFFILFSLFAVICYCNGQSEKLSIHIQNPASEFTMGEQIQFTLVWENISESPIRIAKGTRLRHSLLKLVLEGPVRKECEGIVTLVEEKVGYNSIINPHEKIMIPFVLRDLGIVNAGEYAMRAEFDSTKLESWWDNYKVDRIAVVSNTVEFRLVQPDGIDLQVFEKYKDKCNQIILRPEDLLQKYPASTYAGYALVGNNGHPWPLLPVEEIKLRGCSMRSLEKFPDHPEIRPQMEEQEKKRRDLNQDRADKLKAYLNARPDFVYADFMRLELATRLAYLERYNEAQAICEELIRKAPDSSEAKKARELLDYLATNGWIKEKEAGVQTPLSVPQTTK